LWGILEKNEKNQRGKKCGGSGQFLVLLFWGVILTSRFVSVSNLCLLSCWFEQILDEIRFWDAKLDKRYVHWSKMAHMDLLFTIY